MNTLGIYDIILLMGVLQGAFLILILFRIKNRNETANKFLAIFLLLISLTMVGRLLHETNIFKIFPNFLALPDAIIFLYGPLLYLYFRKLLVLTPIKRTKEIALFIPAILFIISEIPLLLEDNHWMNVIWKQNTRLRFILIEAFAIGHNVFFLFLNYKLFVNYKKTSNNNYSYPQYPVYLKPIFILISLTILVWVFSYFSWVLGYYNLLSKGGYRIIWLILPLLTYVLGYYAMKNPEYFRMEIKNTRTTKKLINDEEKSIILGQIQDLMETKKLYLNPKFNLQLVSKSLSIDRNKISQFINNEFEKNFNEWTNDYRIIDAKSLLSNTDKSIKEIYFEVGFNSKSAFNKAFKERVKHTPTKFRNIN